MLLYKWFQPRSFMKAPAEVPTHTPEHPGHFRVKQFKHQPLLEAAFKTLSQGLARGTFCFPLFHLRMKTNKKIERLDSFCNLIANAGRRSASVLIYYRLHHWAELLSACFSPLLPSFEAENEVTPYPPPNGKALITSPIYTGKE